MFARDGYLPLSRLWKEFESKYRTLCSSRAIAYMKDDPHLVEHLFGTGLDLCEDAFLKSFEKYQLQLVPLYGDVVQVDPVLNRSGAKLLLKATALESALIGLSPDEAGPDGKWVQKMGSSAFLAADIEFLWPKRKGRSTDAELERVLFANVFHTLPILFERTSFVIAKELPPWTEDLLEDNYIRSVWQEVRGHSICLTEAAAGEWRKSLSSQSLRMILNELVPLASTDADQRAPSAVGRPQKVPKVVRAYLELGLKERKLTRQQEQGFLEAYLGEGIDLSTLYRALRALRSLETEHENEKP